MVIARPGLDSSSLSLGYRAFGTCGNDSWIPKRVSKAGITKASPYDNRGFRPYILRIWLP